ncbi:hypothetical protein D3C79_1075730 [compost metagenome]
MGRAARQRCHAGLLQLAVRLNAVADDPEGRAHANVEVRFIRVDRHRLYLARYVDGLQQIQCAGVI